MTKTDFRNGSIFKRGFRLTAAAVFVVLVGSTGWMSGVSASLHGYEAQEMISSGKTIEMQPGETRDFTITFKNSGTSTWSDGGSNFVSVYTYNPKYRKSVFEDSTWYRADQPTKISGQAASGQLGVFRFRLHAPTAEGSYGESFYLAAENLAWIPGGAFTLQINVRRTATAVVPTPVATNVTAASSASDAVSNDRTAYSAAEVSRSANTVNLAPGERGLFSIMFRNTGRATWLQDGRRFVSIYTYEPKYRISAFQDSSWYRPDQPTHIATLVTAPGQLGEVKFYLKAPSVPGTYRESFYLAAEDLTWIPGGLFTVTIVVGNNGGSSGQTSSSTTTTEPPSVTPTVETADGYSATKMLTTGDRVQLSAGDIQDFRVAFKNSGILPWVRFGSEPVQLRAVTSNAQTFRDSSWNGDFASMLGQDRADPGQLAFFNFKLKAPRTNGIYLARFELQAGDRTIEGGSIEIPIEVSGGSVSASVPLMTSSEFSNAGPRGPNIRVGLFTTASPVVVAAVGTYQLIDGRDHQPVKQLSGVTSVTFDFSTYQYTVRNGAYVYTSDYHVHLRPDNADSTIFEITSYENRPSWDMSLNFNKFRGDLAVHYMRSTGNLWVIEELPIEDYMRGLAETSNGSHQEYQRALVTAARTYALYVLSIGGKHEGEYHDVNTTAGDQVYKGYASELVRPNVAAAVEATRGMVVTYNGELVVTPYFSRSDGRTRSWSEVWGGSKPWCVSVPTPYDQGKTLWGHGVGMSASDALGRAEAGASWTEILRYYYTGTEVRQIY